MPQQMAMPQGIPSQMGIGALAAQRQQAGQMDPRMMAMMQALGGNRPQPAMPMNQQAAMQAAQMQAMQQQGGQGSQNMQSQLQAMGLDGPRSPAQEMQYQQFMQQQPQMTPMGPMTQQQIASMTPDMRQQMNAMQNQADMQRRLASGDFPGAQGGMPGGVPVQRPMPGMSAPGGVRFMDNLQAPVAPGDVLVQRPLPVGAGGKGAGMGPPPGALVSQPARPGVPSTMINPPRPMVANNPRAQAAQSANPRLAQMMRGRSR